MRNTNAGSLNGIFTAEPEAQNLHEIAGRFGWYCLACASKLQKRGLTKAKTQRWFCAVCNTSNTKPRQDLRQAKVAKDHVSWLLSKQTQAEFTSKARKPRSARTFRRKIAWCWNTPSLAQAALTGEIHHAVLIDGIRIGDSVCLIARTTKYVIAWHWVPYESNECWTELLSFIPAPVYVVCDGQKGMLKSIQTIWPNTIVQRCRFHAWLNVKAKLTLHPETTAGLQLLTLTRDLLHIHTKRQARHWKRSLKRWYCKHGDYIAERTVTSEPAARKRWHYTHARLRSAYRQLRTIQDDLLRAKLPPEPKPPQNNQPRRRWH